MAELLPVVSQTKSGLFAANNQIYVTVENSTVGTPQADYIAITLLNYFILTGTFSFTFNFNGVSYTYSNTSVNTATTFGWSSDLTETTKNIFTTFSQNNVFDDYVMNVFVSGFNLVVRLDRTSLYKLDATVAGYTSTNTSVYSTYILNDYFFGTTDTKITLATYTTGDLVNLYDNVELGLDVYNYKFEYSVGGGYLLKTNKIASISKKGFSKVDFDLSSIVTNTIDKSYLPPASKGWTSEYLYSFLYQGWQKWSNDEDNNYNISYVGNPIQKNTIVSGEPFLYNLYAIDATYPLLSKASNEIFGQVSTDCSLDLESNGKKYYNDLLSYQPYQSEINRGINFLNYQNYTTKIINQPFQDEIVFRIEYTDNTSETVIFKTDQINKNGDGFIRYINTFAFEEKDIISASISKRTDWIQMFAYFRSKDYVNRDGSGFTPFSTMNSKVKSYFPRIVKDDCDDNTSTDITYTPIRFRNQKGGWDVFEFDQVNTINHARSIDVISTPYTYTSKEDYDFRKIYNMNYEKTYSLKSRTLSPDEFKWLGDLLKSTKVTAPAPIDYSNSVKKLDQYPIIITGYDYQYKSDSDLTISIEYQYARPENI